jgi:hypothetical protein
MNMDLKEKVYNTIKESNIPLSEDTIIAIVTMEDNIDIIQALLYNLKNGKLKATVKDKTITKLDINNFVFTEV